MAATSTLVALAILVAVNYIGQQQNKRWDLTENQLFSLSDQSRNVLSELDSPLAITVFAQEQDFPRFRDRIGEYEYASSQVTTEYVDPDKERARAQQNDVQAYGTIIVNYQGRTERTTMDTEQDITNTIIKAVTGAEKKVYFTQGHGEKAPATAERDGYSGVADALRRENYGVEPLALAQAGRVPEDASVVVVAGPQTDFLEGETAAIDGYLATGGKLLLMLDPPERADATPLPNLVALASNWGVEVGNDMVVDVSGMGRMFGASEAMPLAVQYPPHAITDRFSLMTLFPLTRSVSPMAAPPEGRRSSSIVQTGDASWAETNLKGLFASEPSEPNEAEGDQPGPISIATAAAADVPNESADAAGAPPVETRVVVFGDSDFPSNAYLGFQGNRDLFMNSIGWLVQQENLISIRPKEAGDRRITMTATQQSNVIWLALLIIPGLIFGTGVYSWWRRR
jgi:ABC-type uncharacterized transport system involved in gliding motility auxiliary subunit